MDINAKKIELMEWLSELTNEATLEKIFWLKENQTQVTDWWNEISEAEKAAIEKGIDDIKNGRVTPNEDVWEKYKKWLKK